MQETINTLNTPLEQHAAEVGRLLHQHTWRLTTVESCTGGWIAQTITAIAGSSQWFDCGFVTYSNHAKQQLLGIDPALIQKHGAVSQEIALQMAQGGLRHSQAHIAIAVTGIAGPDGGTPNKPVGTVYIAYCLPHQQTTHRHQFSGNRQTIRQQTVATALQQLITYLNST